MPNKKISQLVENTNPNNNNIMPIVGSGATEYITLGNLTTFITNNFSGGTDSGLFSAGTGSHSIVLANNTSISSGNTSIAFGNNSVAGGNFSYTEGSKTTALGIASHAQGSGSTASGYASHAAGLNTIALGDYSFVHGVNSKATGFATNILGSNITGSTDYMTYVNSLNISSVMSGTSAYNLGIDVDGNVVTGVTSNYDNVVTVAKSGGDFSSIKAAVDSITDSSASNRYLVSIGLGVFYEDTITLSPFIVLEGLAPKACVIQANNPDTDLIIGAPNSVIRSLEIVGVTGSSKSCIVYSGSAVNTNYLRVLDCRFNTSDRILTINSDGGRASVLMLNCDAEPTTNFSKAFYISDNGVNTSDLTIQGFYWNLDPSTSTAFENLVYANGTKTHVHASNVFAINEYPTTLTGNCYQIENGASLSIQASSISGFENAIITKNIGAAPDLKLDAVSFDNNTNNLILEHSGTTGYMFGYTEYNKQNITDVAPFFIANEDLKIITVSRSGQGGNFYTISEAASSITGTSATNRYKISVGPGIFTEPEIFVPSYVSIEGSAIQATIIKPSGNNNVFNVQNPYVDISFLTIQDVPSGYSGIYVSDAGNFVQAHKLSFYDCDTNIFVESTNSDVVFYGEYIDFNNTYTYGTKVVSNNGYNTYVNLENYYNFPIGTGTTIANYASGSGVTLMLISSDNIGNSVSGSTCILFQDNAFVKCSAVDLSDWGYGIRTLNNGSAPTFKFDAIACSNSLVYDFSFEHPTTSGVFNGSSSHNKVNNLSNNISWAFLDIIDGEFEITNKIAVTFTDGSHTDMSTLVFEGGAMGLFEGGELTVLSGLTINIGSGYGYIDRPDADGIIKRIDWSGTTLSIDPDSDVYVYINQNGNLTNNFSLPNSIHNIILGRVVTNNNSILFIDDVKMNASHSSNNLDLFNRKALGPVYNTGSLVTENVTPFHLNVSQGNYFYSMNEISPSGGTNITFLEFSRNSLTGWTSSATTVVSNTYFDNNGTLSGLTASAFTKHTLYTLGDGSLEKYLLVIGQSEYSTLVEAENASLPTPPTSFVDGVTPIASIYIRQGSSSIVEIEDIRPIVGFKAGGVNASSIHGNLLGLSADDHQQYLLVNGDRALTGDLNLGGNDIISATTINGIVIESHAARHKNGGDDEIATFTPTGSAIPKADVDGKLDSWISDSSNSNKGLVKLSIDPTLSTNPIAMGVNDPRVILPITAITYNYNTLTTTNITGGTQNINIIDVFVTGGTYSNGTTIFTNNTGGTFSVTGLYTGRTDVFVTGGTYSNGTAIFTNNTGGTFNVAGFKTSDVFVTGGTYSNGTAIFTNNTGGTFTVTGLYTGSTDVFVTGGTYSNGTAIFTNNTGGTFNVTGFKTTDVFVTGGTYSNGTAIFTNNTGGTFNVAGFKTNDVFVTGGTYSNGTAIFTNNTGGTFNVSGFKTTDVFVTGGTYSNGTAIFTNNTGGTFNVTGFNTGGTGGFDVFVTGGTYSNGSATFTNNTGGTFNVSGFSSGSSGNLGEVQFKGSTVGSFSGTPLLIWDVSSSALTIGGSGTVLTSNPLSVNGNNASSWVQSNVQNTSNGGSASSDIVATADNGDDNGFYVDFGINSSGYNDTGFTINQANDGYIYASGGDFAVGTDTVGKEVLMFVGGTLSTNEVARFKSNGLRVISGVTATTISATTYVNLPSKAATQTTPADPTTTTSLVGVMMGLSGTVTPLSSGTVLITINGDINNATNGSGAQVQIRTGTGSIPTNGSALTGTTRGSLVKMVQNNAAQRMPFSVSSIVSGLTVGTPVWIDLSLAAITSGTARIRDVNICAVEI